MSSWFGDRHHRDNVYSNPAGSLYSDNDPAYSDTDIRRTYSAFVDPLICEAEGEGPTRGAPGGSGAPAGAGREGVQYCHCMHTRRPFLWRQLSTPACLWRGSPGAWSSDVVVNSTNEVRAYSNSTVLFRKDYAAL